MKKKIASLLIIPCFTLTIACERDSRDIAGVQKSSNSPAYTADVQPATMSAMAHVAEVAPKVAGELDGKTLYATNCSACHQAGGTGIPGVFPPLDGSPYVTGDKVERMASIMLYGLTGPVTVLGTTYNSAMAPLGTLKDAELAAIATYVRSAWSNKADPIAPEVFAAARQKWGSRGMFQISELGEEK